MGYARLGFLKSSQGDAESALLYEHAVALARRHGNNGLLSQHLFSLGFAMYERGELQRAHDLCAEAYSIEPDPRSWRALYAAGNLGEMKAVLGDVADGLALCEEALSAAREVGNKVTVLSVLLNLAVATEVHGDVQQARALSIEALDLGRELGQRSAIASALDLLERLPRATNG